MSRIKFAILTGIALTGSTFAQAPVTVNPPHAPMMQEGAAVVAAAPLASPDVMPTVVGGSCQTCPTYSSDIGACCQKSKLFGVIAPSDQEFCSFTSPQTNPLFFEDPRTLTELRAHFVNHKFPNSNPVLQGGTAQYVAVQARIALTDRLSIIATKDGYIWTNFGNPALGDPDGWADLAAGLKYNLIRDPENQRVLSAGLTYEFDLGSHSVFQGRGDGEFHVFLTGAQKLNCKTNLMAATGARLPVDSADRSQMMYLSSRLDHEVVKTVHLGLEANWFHWLKSGNVLPVNFEGGDLINFGSTDVAGNNLVTLGAGVRKRFGKMNEFGVAYEIPVTDRKDILESRLYVDLILRY